MKLKIWSILIVFVLVLFISSTGVNAQCDDAQKIFSGPGVDWLLKKVKKPYTLDELAKIFRERNYKLSMHFVRNEFKVIAEYYGDGGVVRTYDDNYVYGKSAIAEYFAKLKKEMKIDVVIFETAKVYIDVDEYLFFNKTKNYNDDFVYTIHEVISIFYDREGRSVDKDTSSTTGPHSRPTFRNGE